MPKPRACVPDSGCAVGGNHNAAVDFEGETTLDNLTIGEQHSHAFDAAIGSAFTF